MAIDFKFEFNSYCIASYINKTLGSLALGHMDKPSIGLSENLQMLQVIALGTPINPPSQGMSIGLRLLSLGISYHSPFWFYIAPGKSDQGDHRNDIINFREMVKVTHVTNPQRSV